MKKSVLMLSTVILSIAMASATSGGVLTGWVSDAKCGANVNPDCAKKCAEAGEKIVFVTSDKKVLEVANPAALKGHAGEHVKVKGKTVNGTLTVSSVQVIKDAPAGK